MPDTSRNSRQPNALINQTSPYLLQHAYNPVNWYPWGEEAMLKAQEEDKLVIVSIGYSSCHWCHVMERESYEDREVAELMNESFISIKVDREERPDIDHLYMTAVQLMDHQGGWPLNCIALPDGRPIWGGTYFTKEQWMSALKEVERYYRANPDQCRKIADQLAAGIRQQSILQEDRMNLAMEREEIRQVVMRWSQLFDKENGGHQGSPKFPMPVNLEFLLHYGYQYQDRSILDHVDLTLKKMARGGIYDQVGGGFSRYSVDPFWKVPHFEKMLYDNAQLLSLYSHAYQLFGHEIYSRVIRQTIGFICREMRSGEGLFYSALDADSEGTEGKYYTWKEAHLKDLLKDDFDLFADIFHIHPDDVWENGCHILYRSEDPADFAVANQLDPDLLIGKIESWNTILLAEREKRIRPGLDDKSITSWNALMISGLINAGRALGEDGYLELAETCGRVIRDKMISGERILFRTFKNGIPSIPGFHVDYALYIGACLDLYEATMDEQWFDLAAMLTDKTMGLFFDHQAGMFQYIPAGSDILIANLTEVQDSVIPSSNSVMAHNLFRIGHITAESDYLDMAESMMGKMMGRFEQFPYGFAGWGQLLLKQKNPFFEIAVVGPAAARVAKVLAGEYLPHALLAATDRESHMPLFLDRYETDKTAIFVCQDHACQLPVEDLEDAKAIYHIG